MCVFICTLLFHEQTSGVALCKAAFFFIFNALFSESENLREERMRVKSKQISPRLYL